MVPISWYQRIEQREITEGYTRCMQFDTTFLSWLKVLLHLTNLSNILSLDHVTPRITIVCFWFQTLKNDGVYRKVFERCIAILNVLVYITEDFFSQLVSIFEKLDSKFESLFIEELKVFNNTLLRYVHLFILIYSVQNTKRLVT